MKPRKPINTAQILARAQRRCRVPEDRRDLAQIAAIAEWQARAEHDGKRPLAHLVNSRVKWALFNEHRRWTSKAHRPAVHESYSTVTDQVEVNEE